jgi:hypothetical protein
MKMNKNINSFIRAMIEKVEAGEIVDIDYRNNKFLEEIRVLTENKLSDSKLIETAKKIENKLEIQAKRKGYIVNSFAGKYISK